MYKCNFCELTFKTKHSRGGHQRVHSNKKRSGKELIYLKIQSDKQKNTRQIEYFKNPLYCNNCFTLIPYEKGISKIREQKYKKIKNVFCNSSCSATYNNKNKTYGNRRSKLEIWLEEQLTSMYPNLEIHYNRKDTINSELDIYIPSLKVAFELNGIFHYEPIYGEEKLKQIENNDNRKFQACLEQGISLCIIDTSKVNYFKEKNIKPFLQIIKNIIDNKLSRNDLNVQCLATEVPKTSEFTNSSTAQ
jgi:hypothetical protein